MPPGQLRTPCQVSITMHKRAVTLVTKLIYFCCIVKTIFHGYAGVCTDQHRRAIGAAATAHPVCPGW